MSILAQHDNCIQVNNLIYATLYLMRKNINLLVIFYVIYFTWLFLVAYLWTNAQILTYFLLGIILIYFMFLREKYDIFIFTLVSVASYLIGKYLAYDPGFAKIGYPSLGIPYWPLAWGISTLALRKFYLLFSKNPQP